MGSQGNDNAGAPLEFIDMVRYMVHDVTMTTINIAEAKAHLSEVLHRVENGETIIVSRRNQPVAEIRPVRSSVRTPRPIGLCAGEFRVPDDFDAPLPDAILDAFEGR